MVACGAQLTADGPVRIGLPLDGWDLAVVDENGAHVGAGEVGELIIGGVGLARYLDPAKDAEKYAPVPHPGLGARLPQRRPGRVRRAGPRLRRPRRRPGQARRSTHRARRDRQRAARPARSGRRCRGGPAEPGRQPAPRRLRLRGRRLRPRDGRRSTSGGRCRPPSCRDWPRCTTLPTRTSGKVDRDALPWPLVTQSTTSSPQPALTARRPGSPSSGSTSSGRWSPSEDDDFFDLGGGSLTAAQMVSRLRERYPEVTVADLYENPTVESLATMLDEMSTPAVRTNRKVRPTPSKTQIGQIVFTVPLRLLSGLRWLTWVVAGNNVAASLLGLAYLPTFSWWWVLIGWTAPGLGAGADGAERPRGALPAPARSNRATTRGEDESTCGSGWPNGSPTSSGPPTSRGRPGCRRTPAHSARGSARDVDLHSLPPVTGMLTLGDGCSVEPEVDLSGHWLDGDVLHIGPLKVGCGCTSRDAQHAVPGRHRRSRGRGGTRVRGHRQGHEGASTGAGPPRSRSAGPEGRGRVNAPSASGRGCSPTPGSP